MKTIPLTQGLVAMVDDADFDELSQHLWYAKKHPHTAYAVRGKTVDGAWCILRMHRIIMGDAALGLQVDHIDGNGLNNQRANLRVCTAGQNQFNKRIGNRNTTGFKGVSVKTAKRNSVNKHTAGIRSNGKTKHLGHFPTAEQAHAAYCEAAKKLYGDFARFV